MGQFVYPKCWETLALLPHARAELISFVRDVAQWNAKASPIRINGADDLIGFFYDTYDMTQGASNLVGQLIFPSEAKQLDKFFEEFDGFINEWDRAERGLGRLHEAHLPAQIIEKAETLLKELEQRGVPKWRK